MRPSPSLLVFLCFLLASPGISPQQPVSPSSGACLFCPAPMHLLRDRFVFRSPCPEVWPSYIRGGLGYVALAALAESPQKQRGFLLDAYSCFTCARLRFQRSRTGAYRWLVPERRADRQPLALKPDAGGFYRPYDRFKSDIERLEAEAAKDWGGLGFVAVDLLRDFWRR
ncbi:MAG: hypothetical protein IPM81_05215 [Saprospirales bacterium]|nr:hypothetical protein [Saprospirales bacterium]